ncbi:PIG-L deacetylase family protein [Actinomycetospora chiangmaiensis]|uniref:PIG-L deacetylase family protein n=1 Tax=Actinomycetospora chiangmaiensis TaxID=402650 RepID=UPI00036E6CAC|nr:PIG-L family deacetylase [Actinomycetospora chiangmaiensis]
MADFAEASDAARETDASVRAPWSALETLRPLTLRSCRRIVVVAPHPRDEIRAAGGLLRRLGSRHAEVDVLSLTERPTLTCPPPSLVEDTVRDGRLPDVVADGPLGLDDLLGADLDDLDDDLTPEDDDVDPDEAAAEAAYRALGLSVVRRHRLGLPDGGVAAAESDVVAAISEIVGFSDDPGGLCVLAPWSGDGDDDHEAAGRAAEVVTAAYRVRLVRWLDRAWTWAGPDSSEVPWRRARQVLLTDTLIERKHAASAAFTAALRAPGRDASDTEHDAELPDGWAPGPREVFLV